MSDAIVWKKRDPLYGLSLDEFEAELRRLLKGRVESAWIFGSIARGGISGRRAT